MLYSDLLNILSLILMEGVLSIDNATVLATMVKHLKPEDQKKALKYGIIGAYIFRGISLFLASWLIKFSFLKLTGGVYLLYLTVSHFNNKENKNSNTKVIVRSFWMTVLSVEIMDMIFSIDNVFAAVALSQKIWVVITGVFIGILVMRFIAGKLVLMIDKYPELENSAYIVIGILGTKLTLGFIASFFSLHGLELILEGYTVSIITSLLTITVFAFPLLKKMYQTI